MNKGTIGAGLGIVFGLIWLIFGFWDMLLVLILALIGWFMGQFVHLDMASLRKKIQVFLDRQD